MSRPKHKSDSEAVAKCGCGAVMRTRDWAAHWNGCNVGSAVPVTEQDVHDLVREEQHRSIMDVLYNDAPAQPLPRHNELLEAVRGGTAELAVDRINHREFVRAGIRYFCGWSSHGLTPGITPALIGDDGGGTVVGWVTYKAEREKVNA